MTRQGSIGFASAVMRVVASAALAVALVPLPAFAEDAADSLVLPEGSYVPGEMIVVYEDDVAIENDSDALSVSSELIDEAEGAEVIAENTGDEGATVLVDVDEGANVAELSSELSKDPNIAYAQPNYVYVPLATTDDTSLSQQYYLDAWSTDGTTCAGANIKAAWDETKTNQSVTIAVVDTGCNISHVDLAANIDTEHCYNAKTGTKDVADENSQGHGTHVCGIAGAVANNKTGVAGVSYNAKILPIKIFYLNEKGEETTSTSEVVSAYSYLKGLVDRKELTNLHVINLSLGGYEVSRQDLALNETIGQMADRGVLTVCAAGNSSKSATLFPADLSNAFAVCALDKYGAYSYLTDYNESKDIAAPGMSVYSTASDGTYKTLSGTSMAAPVVSGIAALLWSVDPDLTVAQVRSALTSTTHKVNSGTYSYKADKMPSVGAVDAAAAVKAIKYVAVPKANNAVYDGASHVGVAGGDFYTLAGTTSATELGTYEAIATLKSGHLWADGSSEPKTITWAISEEAIPVEPTPEEPETPAVEEPETPAVEEPETPAVEEPETPAVEEPETPVVEEPQGSASSATASVIRGKKYSAGSGSTAGTYSVSYGKATYWGPAKGVTKATVPSAIKMRNGKIYPVVAIAKKAFYKNKKLTKVTVGKNVARIGSKAFYGCSKLKTIVIKSKKLKASKVGAKAFKGVATKARVKVPSSKLKSYKKWLRSRGLSKKATVKK